MSNRIRASAIIFCLILLFSPFSSAFDGDSKIAFVKYAAPELLRFEELKTLGSTEKLNAALELKLNRLLSTPFVNNEAYYKGARPKPIEYKNLGPSLRVLFWNINRGNKLDDILAAIGNRDRFSTSAAQGSSKAVFEELEMLRSADVLMLAEVDMGVPRTNFRCVVKELADALGMNYAYGVEFVEIAPSQFEQASSLENQKMHLGLHGSALLSRYPIVRASLRQLKTQPFDWFKGNLMESDDDLDSLRRLLGSAVFGSKPGPRQLRRGGRMLLTADIEIPDLPEGTATLAVTHLESSASPQGRLAQMKEILECLQPLKNPVILAGDLNTSGVDRARGKMEAENIKKAESELSIGELNSSALDDAAKRAIDLMPNPEKEIFREIARLRFADGRTFDFRGNAERSSNGSAIALSNSNEVLDGAYAPTFELERTIGNIGKFKLDWILVKGYLIRPMDEKGSYRFAPHFGRTLRTLNYNGKELLSDHSPAAIILPLREPNGNCAEQEAKERIEK